MEVSCSRTPLLQTATGREARRVRARLPRLRRAARVRAAAHRISSRTRPRSAPSRTTTAWTWRPADRGACSARNAAGEAAQRPARLRGRAAPQASLTSRSRLQHRPSWLLMRLQLLLCSSSSQRALHLMKGLPQALRRPAQRGGRQRPRQLCRAAVTPHLLRTRGDARRPALDMSCHPASVPPTPTCAWAARRLQAAAQPSCRR